MQNYFKFSFHDSLKAAALMSFLQDAHQYPEVFLKLNVNKTLNIGRKLQEEDHQINSNIKAVF